MNAKLVKVLGMVGSLLLAGVPTVASEFFNTRHNDTLIKEQVAKAVAEAMKKES